MISNLPESATAAQLLRGICAENGILSIALFDTSNITGTGAQTARVEFCEGCDARDLFEQYKGTLVVRDAEGACHSPTLSYLPDAGHLPGEFESYLMAYGCTRTIRAKGVPAHIVWFSLNALGLSRIVNADYDHGHSTLTMEFYSIHAANIACHILYSEEIPDVDSRMAVHYKPNATTENNELLENMTRPLPHVPQDHLHTRFNQAPYNEEWPEEYYPIMRHHGLRPRVMPDPEDIAAERRAHVRLQVDTISVWYKLSASKWSWQQSPCHLQRALIRRMTDTDWREAFDTYFQACQPGKMNLWGIVKYSAVAAHRRERCAAEGLHSSAIPSCENCPFGCRDARKPAGPAPVIVEWLNRDDSEDDDDVE